MKLFINKVVEKDNIVRLKNLLTDLQIKYDEEIYLGEIFIKGAYGSTKLSELKDLLLKNGFEVLSDRKKIIIEQVKLLVIEMLKVPEPTRENYSAYISNRIHLNYTYVANLFSELVGITIEHFIINQKIEQAKQLLATDKNIGEVADILNYSSIGHFSNQFKKVTGHSPSQFKRIKNVHTY